jgi:uncharacterized protein (TIGR04141 family)
MPQSGREYKMGQLNLYKIDSQKHDEFENALVEKYDTVGTEQIINRSVEENEIRFELSFFLDTPYGENPVEWSWLLNFFGGDAATSRSNPKGILVIKGDDTIYACTYGFSFFVVDKYCDTDFAFDFARRVKYKEVKTTTLLSPSSKRNKVVNTYLDYNNLEFDSGESFAKLKVKADLPEGFVLFDAGIEAGHSIKFEIPHDTVDAVIDVLLYVKNVLLNIDEIYKIPVFNKVTDKELIEQLNNRLATNLEENPLLINLSELDIVGVTEVFNNNDSLFEIKYRRKSDILAQLTSDSITDFIQKCGLSLYEGLEKVKVISYYNGAPVRTDALYNLIDYIDDERRCVLSKGTWYYFNDDYLGYLAESLAEIDVVYDPRYDYNTALHEEFIAEKYEAEKSVEEYIGLEENEIKKKLRKKYYRERAYNLHISEKFGFECHDREEISVGGARIELMDLYKDETLFAVKIGNASSVLCYVVDQSISTMKLYKQKQLENLPSARKFGVWILLDRRTHLDDVDGKPNINQLEMLALKNKLDAWKKEVRILGYTPIIMLNYFN